MSKIIKASEGQSAGVKPFVTEEWIGDAEAYLTDSKRQAEAMITEARRQSEAIEREAYQRGFSQGEKAGLALGQQKFEPVQRAFTQLLEQIASVREELLEQSDQFVLQMGFIAACEIVHHEITSCDDTVLSNVRAALEKVVRGSKLTLRVSPNDYKLVHAHLNDLIVRLSSKEDFKLESDAEIMKGGCFLSTESGDIDAQIDTQLTILREQLLGED